MAHLQPGLGEAGVQLAAHHQAASDAGAQGDHHCGVAALGRAGPVLTDSGAVGVVAQIDGHVPLRLEHLPDGSVVKGHVGSLDHIARLVVHQTGQAQAHCLDLICGEAPYLRRLLGQLGGLAAQLCRVPRLVHRTAHLVDDAFPLHWSVRPPCWCRRCQCPIYISFISHTHLPGKMLIHSSGQLQRRVVAHLAGCGCSWPPPPRCWPGSGPASPGWSRRAACTPRISV